MGVRTRWIWISAGLLVLLAGSWYWWHNRRTIIDIPRLIGQPARVIEQQCGVPTRVEVLRDESEARWYARPLAMRVTYAQSGRAVGVYIDPHGAWAHRLRFSGHRRWLARFGLCGLPLPDENSSLISRWHNWHGMRIEVRMATSGDWGVDVGGDSDDVDLFVGMALPPHAP